MVDAGLQLVQGIKLFAGTQVGVELHHRVGAVEVAGKIRDKGLAGHLGLVRIDGGPGPQAGGRGIPGIADPGAGDVDAVAGHLEARRVDLVDGGHAQCAPQTRPEATIFSLFNIVFLPFIF